LACSPRTYGGDWHVDPRRTCTMVLLDEEPIAIEQSGETVEMKRSAIVCFAVRTRVPRLRRFAPFPPPLDPSVSQDPDVLICTVNACHVAERHFCNLRVGRPIAKIEHPCVPSLKQRRRQRASHLVSLKQEYFEMSQIGKRLRQLSREIVLK